MRVFEYVFIAIALLGLFFELMSWPFASVLLIIAFGSLAMFYFALGWAHFSKIKGRDLFKKESYAEINGWQIAGKFLFGWGLSTLLIGCLFKFMNWPGASIQILSGLAMVGVGLLVSIIFYFMKKHLHNIGVMIRGAVYGIVALLLLAFKTPYEEPLDYMSDPNYLEALENYESNPTTENFQKMEYATMRAMGDTLEAEEFREAVGLD